jgi:hypothetical protein
MGLKEEFAKLGNEVREIVSIVKNQANVWKNAVDAQVQRLEDWKVGFISSEGASKNVRSHARLHPACSSASMVIPFSNSYSIGGWTTIEKIQTVNTDVLWADRTAEEKELLTLMGKSGVQHFSPNFDIVKVSWTAREGHNLPWVSANNLRKDSYVTNGAFVKHLSGAVPYGWYCGGLTNNGKWQLCGTHSRGSSLTYINTHPYSHSDDGAGSVLIALPCVVDRYVDLKDPTQWAGILGA